MFYVILTVLGFWIGYRIVTHGDRKFAKQLEKAQAQAEGKTVKRMRPGAWGGYVEDESERS